MYRYYKITREVAEKLGVAEKAIRHPDGMYLVTPAVSQKVVELCRQELGISPLPEKAFEAIGAIGLSIAEAHESYAGRLRHDQGSTTNDQRPTNNTGLTTENGNDTETGIDRATGDA